MAVAAWFRICVLERLEVSWAKSASMIRPIACSVVVADFDRLLMLNDQSVLKRAEGRQT